MPSPKRNEPETFLFTDDGSVPNNSRLPLLLYRGAADLIGTPDPEDVIETMFRTNSWGENMWRNGIFAYVQYHSMIHECMGIARGRVKVRFGGNKGREIELAQGDVCVLPACTGHQSLWTSPDLIVIGAYPGSGTYDLCRGSKAEHAKALQTIPNVPLPKRDPVSGENGPLMRLWSL
jgi:uncharacterized protein YjlB